MKSTTVASRKVSSALSKESEDVLLHHLHSFASNDLDKLMGDYTLESILITHEETYNGPEEIRAFFTELMDHFPTNESDFKLDKLVSDGELVFIVWHATTPTLEVALGTDTFVIKNGKIVKQTFAGKMSFLN
ncbi:MAG: nuclear transport factor 2 family protein [Flavisolibacter sp.]